MVNVTGKIIEISVSREQIVFTIEYAFNGTTATQTFNFPASRFKGKTNAEIKNALVEAFKFVIKAHSDSASEISGGEWVKKADFLNQTFVFVV